MHRRQTTQEYHASNKEHRNESARETPKIIIMIQDCCSRVNINTNVNNEYHGNSKSKCEGIYPHSPSPDISS